MATPYRHEVVSVHGLVRQLASNLLPHGYWFYVTGRVPEGKAVELVDEKLLRKYGIALSRPARSRRKLAGLANLHYLRFDRIFLIIATHGKHDFFLEEAKNIRDIRRDPLLIEGYSITYKRGGYLRKQIGEDPIPDTKWRSRVQISRKRYTELKASFLDDALTTSAESLASRIYNIEFEPYAPVRQQLLNLIRLINDKRKTAGLSAIPYNVIRYERDKVSPFESKLIEQAA